MEAKIAEFESIAVTAYTQYERTDISDRVSLARVRMLGRDARKVFLEIKALHKQLDTLNP
jgi:hypothetical protein